MTWPWSRYCVNGFEYQFKYLGVKVEECMSRHKAWDDVILKLRSWLSKWKVKTLSIGGRLTLLKLVLGASSLYTMSIFKVPLCVLKDMESIQNRFFNGGDSSDKKITWVAWDKVLASKEKGGLGVLSFHALNRALLLKWVWRFISQDGSMWFRVISTLCGDSISSHSIHSSSNWCSILCEVQVLKSKGFDFLSHCIRRIGDCNSTCFWLDAWKGDKIFREAFPRLFALEMNKQISVADKMAMSLQSTFRRPARSGSEQ
uniref:RNA-directed DNA polymerase, eukaryota, reverse transcriptase zinc-binding domain protein n=1 Tax=Tanacetum cinerariifolium TaxID=118510 RepID=A0A699KI77_TANCI|nr:RNA-directed DNA polymerase, eukaryota, reverse transcriptase zinc-binding domain protein [Tanacetum cinerariifolium]